MKHKTGGDFNTGGFLQEPGTYHLCVTDITENPTNKQGQLIDNAAFRVSCEALGGTVAGQEHKTVDILFFHPKPSDKNEGAFARKKIDRFLLSVGLMTDEDKDKEIDIDLSQCVGRQFLAQLEQDEENQKFLRVSFSEIYHVDDPAKKTIPKNEAALRLIPASLRKIGAVAKPTSKPTAKAKATETVPPADAAEEWSL